MSSSPNAKSLLNLHIEHDRLMDCIHCGLCLSQCPTYSQNGKEADSPRGRIYLMRGLYENRIEPTRDVKEHLDLCLGCRACETACPSGVQYGSLLEGTRAHWRETNPRTLQEKLVLGAVEASFPFPNRMEWLLLPIRVLRRTGILPLARKLGLMKLLGPLGDMEALLPPLPPVSKRLGFRENWPAQGEQQARVGMITGCVMQVMQSQVNEATARVLSRVGCHVWAPKAQNCCGALHAHTGDMEAAKAFARRNIEVFEAEKLDAIVINAAGCGSALKEYGQWFKGEAQWESRAQKFAAKVQDISEFLAQPSFLERLQARLQSPVAPDGEIAPDNDVARETIPNLAGAASLPDQPSAQNREAAQKTSQILDDLALPPTPRASRQKKITYHDACHLAHGQGIRVEPRALLELIPNIAIVPLGESEMCCGSAGTYNITQPKMAMELLGRKMKHIRDSGAEVCVTGNPGCAMQIMLGAQKFGPPVEVKHPIQLLDAATREGR